MTPREELLDILHRFSVERNALKSLSKHLLDNGEINKDDYIFIQNVICGGKYTEQMYRK